MLLLPTWLQGSSEAVTLYNPVGWPLPLTTHAFATHSTSTTILRDGSILVQHLARLSAAELSSLPQAQLVLHLAQCQLGSQHTGAVAAALLPGPVLVSALQGSLAHGQPGEGSMEEDREDDDASGGGMIVAAAQAVAQPAAQLCLLVAAQVYAERGTPADLVTRRAWVHATAQQALALLSGLAAGAAPITARSAQLAAQVAQEVLSHPLTHALADSQSALVAAVRLPARIVCLLPVDASAAELLQPYLLAAGLQPSGAPAVPAALPEAMTAEDAERAAEAAATWARVQGLASKLRSLRQAVQAAVLMRGALADENGAAAEPSTLLQLSFWRFQHPKVSMLLDI